MFSRYDKVCCIHHQVAKKQLHIYQMNREAVILSNIIDLHTEGKVVVHVVDNLLVCHNVQKKVNFPILSRLHSLFVQYFSLLDHFYL